MAKARLAIVTKQPAKQPQGELVPDPVAAVLVNIQARLYELKGIIAGVHALAEANDDCGDARWAMEAALRMFEPIIDSIDPALLRRSAAEREST